MRRDGFTNGATYEEIIEMVLLDEVQLLGEFESV